MADNYNENSNDKSKAIFREIDADDPDPESTEIESLCMNCGENVSFYLI
jgi:zinc finger protein